MKSVIIDTNGFLRILLNDIPKQAEQVKRIIFQAKKEQVKIIVPQIILFEIDFILRKYYSFEKKEIIDKLKSLLSATYFVVESRDIFQNAALLYKENDISFVDCFLISKAEAEEAELFTFDQKLKKLTAHSLGSKPVNTRC